MILRPGFAFVVGAALLLIGGCATRGPAVEVPTANGESVGVYRGQVWDGSARRPKFRLLLYARAPDHIHAELIAPVGGAAWVLDAGDGRLSLTVVEDKVAYVGPADAQTVERLFGIAIAPAALVHALLDGAPPGETITVLRLGESDSSLPTTFEIRDGARGFRLERTELRPAVTRGLATGTPPAGVRQVPLDEFPGTGAGE